jgi:hypothetical protein
MKRVLEPTDPENLMVVIVWALRPQRKKCHMPKPKYQMYAIALDYRIFLLAFKGPFIY